MLFRSGANSFTGTPVLTQLPAGLLQLYLSSNNFTGTPVLDSLPAGLLGLYLNNNSFTGTPVLTQLPQTLEDLNLGDNAWCGSTALDISCGYVYLDEQDDGLHLRLELQGRVVDAIHTCLRMGWCDMWRWSCHSIHLGRCNPREGLHRHIQWH